MSDVDSMASDNDAAGITGSVESECEVSSAKPVFPELNHTAQWRGSFYLSRIEGDAWFLFKNENDPNPEARVDEVYIYVETATHNGWLTGFGTVTVTEDNVALITR